MHPPWSIAQSTITAPGRIDRIIVVGHEHRRSAARYEHGADHDVGLGDHALDRGVGARERADAAAVDLIDPAEPVDVPVEHQDLGLHALRDPGRAPADGAGAQHDDASGLHARCAAEQHAAPALASLEEVRAQLRRHASGDLAHRHEQRELTVGELHRLVADRRWCVSRAVRVQRRDTPRGGGR